MTEATSPLAEALARADELPSLPAVAAEVLAICRNEDASLADLAEVLARDPALSAKLLRFSNSSLYNLGQEVTTLQRASLVLGLKTVQLVALSFSLVAHLTREGNSDGFDYKRFWRRSLIRAVAARGVAGLVGTFTEDEAFLCGLLAEVGQLVLADCLTETYAEVLRETGDDWPTPELEQGLLGFQSADAGAALLERWSLPTIIHLGVKHGHAPQTLPASAPRETVANTHVLHLASLVVALLTSEEKGQALGELERCGEDYFGLTPETIYEFLNTLDENIRETSEMINVDLAGGQSTEEVLQAARSEFVRVSVARPSEAKLPNPSNEGRGSLPDLKALTPRDAVLDVPDAEAFDTYLESELQARIDGTKHSPIGMLRILSESFDPRGAKTAEGLRAQLGEVGHDLLSRVRRGDLFAYLGMGQFGMVVQDGTPHALRILAERLRRAVGQHALEGDEPVEPARVTIVGATLGSASSLGEGRALKEVTAILLRRAMERGGNRVFVQARPLLSRRD